VKKNAKSDLSEYYYPHARVVFLDSIVNIFLIKDVISDKKLAPIKNKKLYM